MTDIDKKTARKDIDEFCRMFGLRLDNDAGWTADNYHSYDRYVLKRNRAVVTYKESDTIYGGTVEKPLAFGYVGDNPSKSKPAEYMRKILEVASGKELIIRGTDPVRKSLFGFTRVRTEQHIHLPEFSSVAELKIKMEVMT